jgi:hypothetical protein
VWIREMSENDPLRKHRKPINDTQNQGLHHILALPQSWCNFHKRQDGQVTDSTPVAFGRPRP